MGVRNISAHLKLCFKFFTVCATVCRNKVAVDFIHWPNYFCPGLQPLQSGCQKYMCNHFLLDPTIARKCVPSTHIPGNLDPFSYFLDRGSYRHSNKAFLKCTGKYHISIHLIKIRLISSPRFRSETKSPYKIINRGPKVKYLFTSNISIYRQIHICSWLSTFTRILLFRPLYL